MGWLNIGVCWWHSRLQRSSLYLMNFRPDLPKPTLRQVLVILEQVFRMHTVVEVPGYSNLYDFSQDWEHYFMEYLSWVQLQDTLYMEWVRGIRPNTMSPATLHIKADQIHEAVTKGKIQYLALKTSNSKTYTHAALVVHSVKTRTGYRFFIVDSKSDPGEAARPLDYEYGTSTLDTWVPYLQFDEDYSKIKMAIQWYCRGD